MLVHPGAASLDVTGPLEVFALASALDLEDAQETPPYCTEIVAEAADAVVATAAGIRLLSDVACASLEETDTLLVAGGPVAERVPDSLVQWVARIAPRARRVGSICTGAFILARAGLLDGRRATTHWAKAERLAKRFPEVLVEADCIYTKDGPVYTSAGVTAGIDLALALVEEDLGRTAALNVARMLVLYLKRPGGQSQFSTGLLAQCREGGVLAPTVQWIRESYHTPLSNESLAQHAAMSLRNFARVFKRETGVSPARFVEMTRLEAAVRWLEETHEALGTVARECGFQSGEHLRQAFTRRFGITPGEYRDRFKTTSDSQQLQENIFHGTQDRVPRV